MRALLTTALKGYFEPQFRLRGEQYVLEGRASCESLWIPQDAGADDLAHWAVDFEVRGSRPDPYRVTLILDRIDRTCDMGCTCPMGQDAIPCKHIWAALSEFEVRYPLLLERILPEPTRFRVHCADGFWVEEMREEFSKRWTPLPGFEPAEIAQFASPLQSRVREWYRTPKHHQFDTFPESADSPFRELGGEVPFAIVFRLNSKGFTFEGALRDERGRWRSLSLFDDDFYEVMNGVLVEEASEELLLHFVATASGDPWDFVHDSLKVYCEHEVIRYASGSKGDLIPLVWDADLPYRTGLRSRPESEGVRIYPVLYRAEGEEVELSDPDLFLGESGLAIFRGRLILHDQSQFKKELEREGFRLSQDEFKQFREWYVEHAFDLPRWMEDVPEAARPEVVIDSPDGSTAIVGNIWVRYGDERVSLTEDRVYLRAKDGRMIVRDLLGECMIWKKALTLGVSQPPIRFRETYQFRIPKGRFEEVTHAVLEFGWPLQAVGKTFRRASRAEIRQASGIDWLEIRPQIEFEGGSTARIEDILKAIKNKDQAVRLGDGTFGLLPQEWLDRVKKLSLIADPNAQGAFKLGIAQALLLEDDGLDPEVRASEFRARIGVLTESLLSPEAVEPSPDFSGSLRPYQKVGLSWIRNLRESRLGGILADDMGLGKTIQVLAHLQLVKQHTKKRKPSLIVVPKSLLFNWKSESEKFAPDLKVSLHATYARLGREAIEASDVVIVTYQTLVRDSLLFLEIEFDTVVLDEGQMIKNRDTQSATVCRALKSEHRLVLTGTPVENSVTDLFSIMDFLNPKMLHKKVTRRAGMKMEPKDLVPLARALRPFILRRKKTEVLTDLPPKVESVVYCELSESEKRLYEDIRRHYEERIAEAKTKQVGRTVALLYLEALLRLRQVACHAGLVERNESPPNDELEMSTKVSVLLDQLAEIKSEGRKALVFSQFTSFFDLLEGPLRAHGFRFDRIDGSVSATSRHDRVKQFQSRESETDLMLLSLKAGGTGLNLTAADCVFVLDPWWNIAAENQAIDRAHRIGQTQSVTVYRLIAKDTVEERIQKLQSMKRAISDVLVDRAGVDDLKALSLEDYEYLLSGSGNII